MSSADKGAVGFILAQELAILTLRFLVSRVPGSINIVWSDFVILYCIPDIVILDINVFGPFLLYWVSTLEE